MDRPVTIATGQVNPADMRAPRIEQRRELLRGGEDEIGRTCPKATPGECGGRAVSLMYHDVVTNGDVASSGFDGPGADIYKLDRGEFAQHLAGIALAPSTVDASGTVRGGSPTGLPVFLTFDDGGVTAHSNAAPLLEERGWRGLFYITTDRIGTTGFVSASQLRDLLARGHVIGSHSCSHPKRISDCSRTELQHEWGDSVDALEQILGSPVTTASVPGGFYWRLVGPSAAAAGVKILSTSEPTL